MSKTALITGSTSGIGLATAKAFAARGYNIVFNGLEENGAEIAAEVAQSYNVGHIFSPANMLHPEEIRAMVQEAFDKFGTVDVLVNNAGIMITKMLKDTTDEEFSRHFDINVRGTFNTMREAATRLADKGSVINFSSSTTRMMMPGYGTYVATKGAVEQMTRVFAKEVGSRGINVNCVSPGPTNTELFTTGKPDELIARLAGLSAFNRIGEPEDIARVITFLAGDDTKWISGQNIGVNGAMA